MSQFDIRILMTENIQQYHDIRLMALKESPTSFTGDYAREKAYGLEKLTRIVTPTDNRFILGVFVENQLIATIGFTASELPKAKHKAYIWGVYTRPNYRNRGLARKLLTKLCAVALAKDDIGLLQLNVNSCNKSVIKLYESFGFKEYGLEKDSLRHNNKSFDKLLMCLVL